MTDLERLELALRRVCDDLSKTTRFAASDHMFILGCIIEALHRENTRVLVSRASVSRASEGAKAASLAGEKGNG